MLKTGCGRLVLTAPTLFRERPRPERKMEDMRMYKTRKKSVRRGVDAQGNVTASTVTQRASKRNRIPSEKQRKVLEAAIDVFSEKGFSQASTSEIARRAGVAEGTVFKRYSTKKDLLLEIGLFIASKVAIPVQARELEKLLSRPYPRIEDLLRAFLRNRLDFAKQNRKLLKIAVQELPFHPELQRILRETIGGKVVPAAIRAIDRFKKSGQLGNYPSSTILRMIAAQFMGYVVTRTLIAPEAKWNDDQEIERIVSLLMDGLRR